MAIDIVGTLIDLVINIIFWVIAVAPALWISGRLIAGKHNAKFTDAVWIVVLGTVIFYFTGFLLEMVFAELFGVFSTLLAYVVLLIVWLALVKHFFDCGWLKALAISIVAVIIAVIIWLIIAFILALIGISLGWFSAGAPTFTV
ncbi:MAG: hypothetical protein NWE98_01885 [Candidatus Bathyarchaeota archaeon]|nr:hypothetical protein [Candidatus Bathyarchaeota archaeon]